MALDLYIIIQATLEAVHLHRISSVVDRQNPGISHSVRMFKVESKSLAKFKYLVDLSFLIVEHILEMGGLRIFWTSITLVWMQLKKLKLLNTLWRAQHSLQSWLYSNDYLMEQCLVVRLVRVQENISKICWPLQCDRSGTIQLNLRWKNSRHSYEILQDSKTE